jgi:outer membrane protein
MRIFGVTLAIALTGMLMGSCNQPASTEEVKPTAEATTQPVEQSDKKLMVIAMVHADTIMSKYEYAQFLRDELTTLTLKYEGILRQKETKLRADAEKLQRDAASLSQFEGQNRQRKLYDDQEKLQIKQEEYTRKLMEIEQGYNRNIHDAINEYLGRYCADKPYEMVLSNSDLGIIRWADKSLDITDEVLVGLNAEYEQKLLDEVVVDTESK